MSDRKWYVLMFDDDKTPMEFVTYLLRKVFQTGANDAEHTMLDTHHNGIAICAADDRRKDAVAKIAEASSLAREHRHPLQLRCAFGDAGLGAATLVFHLVPLHWTSDMPPSASRMKAALFMVEANRRSRLEGFLERCVEKTTAVFILSPGAGE